MYRRIISSFTLSVFSFLGLAACSADTTDPADQSATSAEETTVKSESEALLRCGPLPQFCIRCANGGNGCPHYIPGTCKEAPLCAPLPVKCPVGEAECGGKCQPSGLLCRTL